MLCVTVGGVGHVRLLAPVWCGVCPDQRARAESVINIEMQVHIVMHTLQVVQ